MNLEAAAAVVNAVLYEGYILYPYRRSSAKNQQRWGFGGVFPEDYMVGGDPCAMQTQCLVRGSAATEVELRVRFLQFVAREIAALSEGERQFTRVASLEVEGTRFLAWDEAREREIIVPRASVGRLLQGISAFFTYAESHETDPILTASGRAVGVVTRTASLVQGRVIVKAAPAGEGVYRLTVRIENTSPLDPDAAARREVAQRRAFASTHTLLGVEHGAFVSLMDPPEDLRDAAARCENQGTWPILLGRPGATDTMLSSPIILYDHPEVAPESPGDLFDATEIDEILTLRILAMTADEKREMQALDPRARALLARTEGLTQAELNRMHGTLRNPRAVQADALRVGDRVRLRPKQGGDAFDIVLRDQIAIVEAIERDFENRTHIAVTILDDPGRDLGMQRMPGHRFFFDPAELEPVTLP